MNYQTHRTNGAKCRKGCRISTTFKHSKHLSIKYQIAYTKWNLFLPYDINCISHSVLFVSSSGKREIYIYHSSVACFLFELCILFDSCFFMFIVPLETWIFSKFYKYTQAQTIISNIFSWYNAHQYFNIKERKKNAGKRTNCNSK